jgi:3-phosphoshikimate 1-carboxyvinyltransferase
VSIEKSSQFASALLLCAYRGRWDVNIVGTSPKNSPYVNMTRQLIKAFPHKGGEFQIEPDASSGSYFWGADWLLGTRGGPNISLDQIRISNWPTSGWQKDAEFESRRNLHLRKNLTLSRNTDLADSIMTAITIAPFNDKPVTFTDLGRLRVQECERVLALRTELTKCGANVVEEGDTLTVYPSELHGVEIETYNDHRMAMCFATLGLKVPGMKIRNPACVKKTFPDFFQKLAFVPPYGLGATVLDGETRGSLSDHDLFAE